MQNSYAYSLGYKNSGQVMGQRLERQAQLADPLMADMPPANPATATAQPRRPRPARPVRGRHVTFAASRHVGYNQDDIYLNRAGLVAAGVDWTDAVLSSGLRTP